jgi:hypothetical protein
MIVGFIIVAAIGIVLIIIGVIGLKHPMRFTLYNSYGREKIETVDGKKAIRNTSRAMVVWGFIILAGMSFSYIVNWNFSKAMLCFFDIPFVVFMVYTFVLFARFSQSIK